MQSKISFFNKSLYRSTILRNWPLWAFASFIACLVPFSTLIVERGFGYNIAASVYSLNKMIGLATVTVPILIFIYAIICAASIWNYLFSSRSAGMYHSLPIRRGSLFVTNIVAGLTIMMIPFGIAAVLEIIAELIIARFSLAGILIILGVSLGESILFFGFATLMAFLSGHIVALPLLYLFFNFIAVYFQFIIGLFIEGFVYGIESINVVMLDCLSPLYFLLSAVQCSSKYDNGIVVGVHLDNWYIVLIYTIVGILMLLLSAFLYKKRKSECAGDLIAFKPLKTVMQTLVTAAFGIGMAAFIYEIYDSGRSGSVYKALPMLICLIVSVTVGYFITGMFLNKTIRVFNKKSTLGYVIAIVASILFIGALDADVLGIEKKVPDSSQISSVYFGGGIAGGNAINLDPAKDPELVQQILELHRLILKNKNAFIKERDDKQSKADFVYFTLDYQLKNGKSIERVYYIPVNDKFLNSKTTELIETIANSRAVKLIRYGIVEGGSFSSGSVNSYNGTYENFSVKQGTQVMEALIRDVDEGNIPEFDFVYNYYENGYIVFLDMNTVNEETGRKEFANIQLTSDMKNTIKVLLEIEAIKEADLILEKDYYGEDYYQYDYTDVEDTIYY